MSLNTFSVITNLLLTVKELSDPCSQILQRYSDRLSQIVVPAELLYTEGVITKETFDEVESLGGCLLNGAFRALRSTVYKDHNMLKKFASVLSRSEDTVSLADDTNMLKEEIQQGWESTVSSDIWFWNNYSNTTTLKQTITGSDGSVTTQERIIQDTGCSYINCGQFENYSDTYVQGSNTQTDFDIKVDVTNTNNLTGHWGPDIDNIEL